MHPSATFDKLKELVNALEKEKLKYVVMGGFAIDGRQKKITRPHNDIDIVCLKSDEMMVEKVIKQLHYSPIQQYDDLYKLNSPDGTRVDLFLVEADEEKVVSKGKKTIWTFPKEFLSHDSQKASINGFIFTIPGDTYLKKMAIDSKSELDMEFVKSLKSDEKKAGHIKRILRAN